MAKNQGTTESTPQLSFVSDRGRQHRPLDALELYGAQKATPELQRELPNVVRNYRTPWQAYRRLGQVARLAGDDYLSNVVTDSHSRLVVGMASIERSAPENSKLDPKTSAELSYWHRPVKTAPPAVYGQQILDILARDRQSMELASPPIEQTWMVTLPDDEVKALVLSSSEFELQGRARRFDIGDGVTEDRLLWVRTEQKPPTTALDI